MGRRPRTIEVADDGWSVSILDQTALPHRVVVRTVTTCAEMAEAIRTMRVRGAPLIGAAAAYGLCLALRTDPANAAVDAAMTMLRATRPTAVNLAAALARLDAVVRPLPLGSRVAAAYAEAAALCVEDVAINQAIGDHGAALLRTVAAADGRVQVLTHCNAGYLATVDWGTALAPVYRAHDGGVPVHVWISETRPRGQGALTA
ncbi:MAG: S-methyl-5-thioribose-1-phosphate isomerase, partial [Gemmatimonadota bacterium]|nr:S-methyl-5-thioribose-1-phosphate isomerase [Gemmatimonadota bacterium]